MKKINFKEITLRSEISPRGGGIEVNLTSLGFDKVKMTAYQNYLGGGMLGKVTSDCNLLTDKWEKNDKLVKIAKQLREYFFNLTKSENEFEVQSFIQNQNMPISAY